MSKSNKSQSARPAAPTQGVFGARARRLVLVAGLAVIMTGCAVRTAQHGAIFTEAEIQQVQQGMTRDQVELTLGSPNAKSTVGDGVYYYISTKTKTPVGFMEPRVVDRRVLAVYFGEGRTVERVAHYGLEDGKVIDFITRETPTYGGEEGILQELFRKIGSGVNPGVGGS